MPLLRQERPGCYRSASDRGSRAVGSPSRATFGDDHQPPARRPPGDVCTVRPSGGRGPILSASTALASDEVEVDVQVDQTARALDRLQTATTSISTRWSPARPVLLTLPPHPRCREAAELLRKHGPDAVWLGELCSQGLSRQPHVDRHDDMISHAIASRTTLMTAIDACIGPSGPRSPSWSLVISRSSWTPSPVRESERDRARRHPIIAGKTIVRSRGDIRADTADDLRAEGRHMPRCIPPSTRSCSRDRSSQS